MHVHRPSFRRFLEAFYRVLLTLFKLRACNLTSK